MSEDTNTNEKKFHLDEFAMLLGNRMNARREEGGQVCHEILSMSWRIVVGNYLQIKLLLESITFQVHVTKRQLVTFGEQVARCFKFILINCNFSVQSFHFTSLGSSIVHPPSPLSVKRSTPRLQTGFISQGLIWSRVLSSWLQQTKREENKESAKWER